jgi:hypothetical protein
MADGEVQNSGAAYIYAPPTMSPSTEKSSKDTTTFLSGNVQLDAMVAMVFVLIPVAVVGVCYLFSI